MCHYVSSFLLYDCFLTQWLTLTFHGVNKGYAYTRNYLKSKQNRMGFTVREAKQSNDSETHSSCIKP